MGQHQTNQKLNFTVVELLVVIAIISILASVLLPAMNRARMAAQQVSCVSNLKQFGIGIQSYAVDYQQYLPATEFAVDSNHPHWGKDYRGFEMAMSPYLSNAMPAAAHLSAGDPIFTCAASPVRWDANFQGGKYSHDGDYGPYGINSYEGLYYSYDGSYLNTGQAAPSWAPLRHRTYSNAWGTPFTWCSRRLSSAWVLEGSNNTLGAASWHGQTNVAPPRPTLFLDGHVAVLKDTIYTLHGNTNIMLGSYSTWEFANGQGVIPHDPFDFWLDEN